MQLNLRHSIFCRNEDLKHVDNKDTCIADTVTEISSPAFSTPNQASQNLNRNKLSGRRIVDIFNFIQQLQFLNNHSVIGCSFSDMRIISEKRKGLNSGIKFRCAMCNFEKVIWTDIAPDSSSLQINTAAVIGITGVGAGFSNLEEFFSAMDIPCMSKNTYAKQHQIVSDAWEKCASNEMKEAVDMEKELAMQRGDIDANGVPLLTVIVDGTWAKRSYKSNYASLSGAVSKFIL